MTSRAATAVLPSTAATQRSYLCANDEGSVSMVKVSIDMTWCSMSKNSEEVDQRADIQSRSRTYFSQFLWFWPCLVKPFVMTEISEAFHVVGEQEASSTQ